MTAINTDEIRARAEAATPGPWKVWDSCSWRRIGTENQDHRRATVIEPYNQHSDGHPDLLAEREDLDFIAHARTDIPALCDAYDKQAAEIERLKGLLGEAQHGLDDLRIAGAKEIIRDGAGFTASYALAERTARALSGKLAKELSNG